MTACCTGANRERFEGELHRLRGFRLARLLIVGCEAEITTGRYRSGISPKAVLHTLSAFEARYVPVVWEQDPTRAAELVETWAFWFAREILKTADTLRAASSAPSGLPAVQTLANGSSAPTAPPDAKERHPMNATTTTSTPP